MSPADPPVADARNAPMMPLAWIRELPVGDKKQRVFTTTMGAATDFESAGLRRLLVNAVYWCVGLEDQISPSANVEIVGEYRPTPFGFDRFVPGRYPRDYR
jgi:hypothetical protein